RAAPRRPRWPTPAARAGRAGSGSRPRTPPRGPPRRLPARSGPPPPGCARRSVRRSQAQLKRRSWASPSPSPRSGKRTLPFPGTVGLSFTSEARSPPAPPRAAPPAAGLALALALVDPPQLALDGGAVGAEGLADDLGPERPDP